MDGEPKSRPVEPTGVTGRHRSYQLASLRLFSPAVDMAGAPEQADKLAEILAQQAPAGRLQ